MKKLITKGIVVLALVLSLANCGRSGGGNNNNPNTYYPYNPNFNNPQQYNNQFQQMYGYGQNYCNQYAQGCIQCYVPQCQSSGCGWGSVYYAQPGYYNPNMGFYGQGGSYFNMSLGFSNSGGW
jgi:hypothetical protein